MTFCCTCEMATYSSEPKEEREDHSTSSISSPTPLSLSLSLPSHLLYSFSLVEQYSPAIRQSNFVRFAVDIALAFSSNNYAKFFKLVR